MLYESESVGTAYGMYALIDSNMKYRRLYEMINAGIPWWDNKIRTVVKEVSLKVTK